MRSYSFTAIFFLCLAILLVDVMAFYWLQSITKLISSPALIKGINILFWIFTVGLLLAILVLKIQLDTIPSERKQFLISSLYGLTISSFIPKLIFVILISIFYFSHSVFSKEESIIVVPLIGLFSGVLPFFVVLYGIFRSLYRFKVHRVKIKSKELPKNFKGLHIVHISDIHAGSFNYRYHIFDRAVEMINHLDPDLIFFTGDLVNNFAWELRGWKPVFNKLTAKMGKYSVLGNHDYGDYSEWASTNDKKANFKEIKDFHQHVGFHLLLNETKKLQKEGENIELIGVENWGKPPFKQYGNLKKAMENSEQTSFKILLSHDPSHWSAEVFENTDITLTLSGHTHGMQFGVHFKNKKWSPIKLKYKHWGGLYKKGEQYLYVNRGLGWIGFPGRLGMRPEITSITLE